MGSGSKILAGYRSLSIPFLSIIHRLICGIIRIHYMNVGFRSVNKAGVSEPSEPTPLATARPRKCKLTCIGSRTRKAPWYSYKMVAQNTLCKCEGNQSTDNCCRFKKMPQTTQITINTCATYSKIPSNYF